MKRIIINFLLLFAVNSLFAQFSIHLNYSEATKTGIGIGYDFSKRFWSDLTLSRGLFDNTETTSYRDFTIDNISANLSVNYNFIAKNNYDIYLGMGGLLDFYDGTYFLFTVPVGIRLRPFKNLNNIAFQIEVQPVLMTDIDEYIFGRLGIHYRF